MKHKYKKTVKILGVVVGAFVLLLVIITLIINFIFRDQLISYVIHQLNKEMNTTINVKKVDFSLWKKFPNASVEFTDILAFSSPNYHAELKSHVDTLIAAEKLYLDFNLFQLIRGIYQLDRLYINNGKLKIAIDPLGIGNYDIIKKTKNPGKGELNLDLENVVLENTSIVFEQEKTGVFISGFANKLNLKGKFKNKDFKLLIFGELFISKVQIRDEIYLHQKKCKLDFNLNVNDTHYAISSSYADIEKSKFEVGGDFELGQYQKINLVVTGVKLNVNRIVHLLPDNIQTILKNYHSTGGVDLTVQIHGPLDNPHLNPTVDAKFLVHDGAITEHLTGVKLDDITLQGFFTNQKSAFQKVEFLKILNLSAKLGSGFIMGKCEITDFKQPGVHISLKDQVDLNEMKGFFKLDSFEVFRGSVESDLTIDGVIQTRKIMKLADIAQLSYRGQVKLHDVALKLKHNDYHLNKINGVINVDNDIHYDNLEVYLHDNDFKLKGVLTNGVKYFLHGTDKDIVLTAEVYSRNLDLSKYFVSSATGTTTPKKGEYSRELLFPDNISLDVKLNVNRFKLHEFNAKWVTGYVFYKPRMFTLKSLSFETMTGRASGNGVVLQDMHKNFITKGQLDLSHIDIRQMFFAFNNFSQNILRSEHLRGSLSGKTEFSTEWNNALVLNQDKLVVEGDITINNGELVNFEPLQGLSRFISVDELKNIKFLNLTNKIVIKDKQVFIPQMDVITSAFNIKASGIHRFDNHYNYKVNVLLSDVLWGKAKKRKKQNEEFGVIEDDGVGKTTIPLSITGFNSDFKIAYDTKQAFEIAREGMGKQKTELKSILKEEFGWYKKDSTLRPTNVKNRKSNVHVSWDDEDVPTTKSAPEPSIKTKPVSTKNPKDEKIKVEWDN